MRERERDSIIRSTSPDWAPLVRNQKGMYVLCRLCVD
jgi:hypothetical protein